VGNFGFNQGLIARRLFFQVVFLSLLATAIISALQIYFRYGDKLRAIDNELQRIETSHLNSLAANLWHMDEALLRTELQGILNLPNIQFVELRSAEGKKINSGTPGTGDHIAREHPLVFSHRGALTKLGSLTIHADLQPIRRELWSEAVTLSIGEAVKIFVIALLVFFLFQFTVGRHLRNLARQALDLDLGQPLPPFQLRRPPHKRQSADELEYLSSSLNELYANLTATIEGLRHTNEKLDQEIVERKQAEEALRESEERLAKTTENAPAMIYQFLLRPDGSSCFPYASAWCQSMFGIAPEALRQSSSPLLARILAEDMPGFEASVALSAKTMDIWRMEYRLYAANGAVVWHQGISRPERLADGSILWSGIFFDVTDRKKAEEALKSSLAEKESLIKEVHHRVKNNLQIISSLLNLQGRKVQNPELQSFLQDTQNRVRSMALLHETLYQSGNLAKVDLPRYVRSICAHLARSCGGDAAGVRLNQDIADVALEIDQAIPVGLIISELVTNAFKHAFSTKSEGEITVELQASGEQHLVLRVSDNGIGFDAETRSHSSETLGLVLVRNLSRQLDGQLSITGEQGTVFEIVFPAQAI
jgi:PAS domain S-box-containing protein